MVDTNETSNNQISESQLPELAVKSSVAAIDQSVANLTINEKKKASDVDNDNDDSNNNAGNNDKDDDDLEEGEIKEDELSPDDIKTVFDDATGFNVKHPLFNAWTLWFDNPSKKASTAHNWLDDTKEVITFDSVEEFWGLYNNILPPTHLPQKANYYLFKRGIRPAWEDEANADGGKWSVQFPREKARDRIDRYWLDTMLAAIGETLETDMSDDPTNDLITGAIISTRPNFFRLAIWTRVTTPVSSTPTPEESALQSRLERLGKIWKQDVLGFGEGQKLVQGGLSTEVEFVGHKEGEKKGRARDQHNYNTNFQTNHLFDYVNDQSDTYLMNNEVTTTNNEHINNDIIYPSSSDSNTNTSESTIASIQSQSRSHRYPHRISTTASLPTTPATVSMGHSFEFPSPSDEYSRYGYDQSQSQSQSQVIPSTPSNKITSDNIWNNNTPSSAYSTSQIKQKSTFDSIRESSVVTEPNESRSNKGIYQVRSTRSSSPSPVSLSEARRLTNETKDRVKKCPFPGCSKKFVRMTSFENHYKTHTVARPYVCSVCGRSFARKHDGERHYRIHSNDRPYPCPNCTLAFPRSDALRRHWSTTPVCAKRAKELARIETATKSNSNANKKAKSKKVNMNNNNDNDNNDKVEPGKITTNESEYKSKSINEGLPKAESKRLTKRRKTE